MPFSLSITSLPTFLSTFVGVYWTQISHHSPGRIIGVETLVIFKKYFSYYIIVKKLKYHPMGFNMKKVGYNLLLGQVIYFK